MYYFIVNPVSRSGRGLLIWEKTEAILIKKQIEYETFILDGPGKARKVASYLSSACTPCTAVIVGGDGTVNEFLNGLTTCEGITLGYIPTGSGNDFARGMHLPTKPEDALEAILAQEKFRNINIGITGSGEQRRCFAVSSGMGFDAAVCLETNRSPLKNVLNRLHLGQLVYLFHALRMLISMKPLSLRLLLDDSQLLTFQKVYFAAAMNTRYEGGGFMFCPKASPVDNELDLIIVDHIPRLKVLAVLPTAFWGKHVNVKGIHIFRCTRAVLQSDAEACVHTDGEHFGFCKKVTFELMKEKLRLIVD